jgi:hypothetical protein
MPIGNLPDANIPAKTLQDVRNEELNFMVSDIRASNYDKALSIVTPMSEITGNLQKIGALPKEETISSLTMKEASKVKLEDYSDVKASDVYRDYSDGSRIARYDTYSTINLDQEEYAASKQTSSDLWSRGLNNFGLKTLNNTVGQLGGFVYGVFDAARTGSMQSLYDNKFMDYINDFDTYVNNTGAIYKSKADREATGLDYWSRGTTWADDFTNGMAFLSGAAISEGLLAYATGGSSLSTTAARLGARLGQSSKVLKAFNSARKISNPASKVFATGRLETTLGTNFGRAGELLNTARFVATSSGFESAFEANAFKKEMEEGYYEDFERLNGRMPTVEEEAEFRRSLNIAADGVYVANFGITAPSNLLFMGKWFGIKNPLEAPGKWVDSKLFGVGYKKVGEEFVETSANRLQKTLGKTYGFTKGMFLEGIWEEGAQSVVQNTGRNWVEAKYDPKYTKGSLDLIDAFSNGFAETYGTAEGWKEIQMGMLIGLLGGTAGNKIATGKWNPDYSRAVAENKLIVDTRNTYSGRRVAEAMAYGNRVQQAQESSERAEAAGDFTGQEMSRKDAALAQLNFAYNLDYMEDAVSDTVTAITNMDNETLMREYGVDQKGAEELKQKMIDEYKSTAETYKKNSDFAEYFINSKLSKEEKAELKGHDVSALREALAYELTMGAEMDTFSSNILEAIKQKVGTSILGQDISDTLAIEDVLAKAGKETKKEVERKVSQITKLKSQMQALDEEYKKLETTFYNSTSEEGKKTLLAKMDSITAKKSQIEQERNNLARETDILFNTAKLKNPFSKDGSSIVITASKLEVLAEQSKAIRDLVSSYEKVSPQDALALKKLVEEYGRSLQAFQRYADLARQITDPKLGLRGKRNFISEIKRDKSPNEVTLEMIATLSSRMTQSEGQRGLVEVDNTAEVKEVREKDKQIKAEEVRNAQKDGDTITKPTPEEKQATKEAERQKVIDEYDALIAGLSAESTSPSSWVDGLNAIKEALSKLNTKEEKLQWLVDNGYIEPFTQDDKKSNYLKTATGRVVVKVKIGSIIIPFYISTGQGLKTDVETNKWYVFFGQGANGWFNKTSGKDINTQYGVKVFQDIAEILNSVGSIKEEYKNHEDNRGFMDLGFTASAEEQLKTLIDFITPIQPTLKDGSMVTTPEQLKQLKDNIQAVKDRVEKELGITNQEGNTREIEKQIEDLREQEQNEMLSKIPNIDSYKVINGKVDKTMMTTTVLNQYNEIYDKYDKLISPLLEKLKQAKSAPSPAPAQNEVDNTKEIKKLEKEKQDKLDAIDKKYQDKTEEPAQEKKPLIDSIIEMVKNSPYLLENFGSNILDIVPSKEEIEEFYELAARAIDDPRIDTELVAFKNPYNSKRFSPTTRPSLTKAEVTRLQELNQKMANWQLLEGYQNETGISLQQMITQAIAVRQTVEPIIREKLTDSDLINLSDTEPMEIEGSKGIRNEQYVQVYENVFVKKKGNSIQISHLTLPGLLERMGITEDIGYVQTTYEKGKKVEVKGTAKVITLAEVDENSLPGANFIVTLADGSKVNLTLERSGAISMNSEDFPKVMSEANMKHVEGTLNRNGGYSPVYDLESGEKLKTDYKNASEYSPREIYNMEPGESAEVTFSVDMNDEYNLKLIQNYEKGLEEGRSVEELDKELFENLKINVLDTNGRKLGDLKAAYDIAGIPGYLDLRREAFEAFKSRMNIGATGKISLSKSSFIKHIFLGSPNFTFEDGSIKMFDIVSQQVVDYGYIENGKVVLKNGTKNVREDFVKGLLGRNGQPIVVVKQGKYLVAFPVALKESDTNLVDQALGIFTKAKNKAEAALGINQLLADNGFSPTDYNLFYMDENNQNLTNQEGLPTEDLQKAFDDLAGVKNVSSVADWMLPEHTVEDLANEASIGVDMTDNMFSSPKPIIELDDLKENIKDWYAEALKEGDVSEEKALEIATKIFYRKRITLQEAQFVQSDRVTKALDRLFELNDEAQKEANSEKNKRCPK